MRYFISLLVALLVVTMPARAQTTPTTSTATTATTGVQPGEFSDGVGRAMAKIAALQANVIGGAVTLSQSVKQEAGKFAFGLAVITIVMAAFAFAGSHHPISAWVGLLETFLVLGLFAAIYVGYDQFAPGIFNWWSQIATAINGTSPSDVAATLGVTAGQFWDSCVKVVSIGNFLSGPLSAILLAILLAIASLFIAATAIIYTYFLFVGQLQVAVGIVVGPLAVAFGFHSLTRKYFMAWFDYMVSGSLYTVVAAILARLVTGTLQATISTMTSIGTDTAMAGVYALSLSIMLLLVSLEIPKIAGGIFGTGGGISGGAGMGQAVRGGSKLGGLLAK